MGSTFRLHQAGAREVFQDLACRIHRQVRGGRQIGCAAPTIALRQRGHDDRAVISQFG